MIGMDDPNDRIESQARIELLEDTFRAAAERGSYKATGIVYDARTVPPGATQRADAIAMRLDHIGGYSVIVMIPYSLRPGGDLVKGPIFATKGDRSIFPGEASGSAR
jgi:hypothetical protein